ncbi:MAG: hypothetical protein QNK37_14300 [Acidobacteriota bacterium]|nr:hypothetical protein [Acidobacteriota bacterium]
MSQYRQSLKRLAVRIETNRNGQGSGVLVRTSDDRLLVLTALHCLQSPDEINEQKLPELDGLELTIFFFDHLANPIGQVIISDHPDKILIPEEAPEADIAILRLPENHGLDLTTITPVNLCNHWDPSGEYLFYGFPNFNAGTRHANAVHSLEATFYDRLDTHLQVLSTKEALSDNTGRPAKERIGGMSGGGVFLKDSLDLVGVIGELRDDYAMFNRICAQHFEPVSGWLQRAGLTLNQGKTKESPITQNWLETKFRIARGQLDTRYTPEHHVKTDSERILDSFFLKDGFKARFRRVLREVVDQTFEGVEKDQNDEASQEKDEIVKNLKPLRTILHESQRLPPLEQVKTTLQAIRHATDKAYQRYQTLQNEALGDKEPDDFSDNPFDSQMRNLNNVYGAIDDAYGFLDRFFAYDKSLALLEGPAGSGKSHLLATAVENALKRGQTALLVVGEQFTSNAAPITQLVPILGWGEQRVDTFLSALNDSGDANHPAILAIDALNETSERKLWKSHLLSFADRIKQYENIRLLASCRDDFSYFTLPSALRGNNDAWAKINHDGFEPESLFDAVVTYFKGYNVSTDHFPPLFKEFTNPLFLKTFCETYENAKVPSGSMSFSKMLKRRIKKCQDLIQEAIDCPAYIVQQALDLLAERIWENKGSPVLHDDIRPEIDSLFEGGGESKSLYVQLLSNQLIYEGYRQIWPPSPDHPEPVKEIRFPYERFSDYFIASKILAAYSSYEALREDWHKKGLPDKWCQDYMAEEEHRGLLAMLAILIPERFGVELLSLFREEKISLFLFSDLLNSLPWRSMKTITPKTQEYLGSLDLVEYLTGFIKLMAIPGHPFNAEYLHEKLKDLPLWKRELTWTLLFSNRWGDERNPADQALRWAFSVPLDCISTEQARLTALFLTWLLSSNDRFLRTRASLALTRILMKDISIASELIREFHQCNDPYIVERVYGAACGATLRSADENKLKTLALTVYEHMFAGSVPPHILQRGYAQLIIEYVNFYFELPKQVQLVRCKPPFRSKWPRIISEKEAERIENQEGWSTIKSSLQPESSGWYGDFGRYEMDMNVRHFSKRTLKQQPDRKNRYNYFSGMRARRFILNRVKQLGWTAARFEKHERGLAAGRMRSDEEARKTERVSKKYQWIGLHELLGYISDRYHMTPEWGDEFPTYKGPWQLSVRDFDPSQPLKDPANSLVDHNDMDDFDKYDDIVRWVPYPDPFADSTLRLDRTAWVEANPESFSPLIEHTDDSQVDWLNLHNYYKWTEQLSGSQNERVDGKLRMEAEIRCWLIKNEDKATFLRVIKDHEFYGHYGDIPDFFDRSLGEYPWSSSMEEIVRDCRRRSGWLDGVGLPSYQTVCRYLLEDAGISACLPGPMVCDLLNLRWSGNAFEFTNSENEVIAYHPAKGVTSIESSPLLIKKDSFLDAAEKAGLVPLWAILSIRDCYSFKGMRSKSIVMKKCITQRVYGFEDAKLKCLHDKAYEEKHYH